MKKILQILRLSLFLVTGIELYSSLARNDLPEELVYRLAKAIDACLPELAARLVQGAGYIPPE